MKIDKNEFQALIAYYMAKRGLKGINELAEHTLISYKTLLKYMKDPEKFPLGEVGRILESLQIPTEEFVERVLIKKGGSRSEAEADYKRSMRSSDRNGNDHSRSSLVDLATFRPMERNQNG